MFRTLHRVVVVGVWALVVLVGLALYEYRAKFRPVVDEVEILQHLQLNSDPSRVIGRLVGQVVQVTGADSFRVRCADGVTYHFRLEGAQAPPDRTPDARHCREEGARQLSQWILSNHVQVEMSYTNEYRLGLGFVFCNGTNINLEMVRSGFARINPDQLKSLPLGEQHDYLSAQKQAQTTGLGMWK